MKIFKKILLFALCSTINYEVFSQSCWFQQTSWANNYLNSVFFLDYNTGYICGNNILCKTTNGGINWYHISIIVNIYSNYFINTNTGYIVGDPYECFGTVMKTTDGGNSWVLQNPNTTNKLYSVFVVPQTSGNVTFAVGDSGTVVKTTNGGNNWNLMTSGTKMPLYSVYFSDYNTGYVCGGGGNYLGSAILKTSNGGMNWSNILNRPFDNTIFYSVIFINNYIGYASCGSPIYGIACGVFKTTNSGLNWNGFNGSFNVGGFSSFFTSSNNGYVVGGEGYIFKTINGGSNWYIQNSGTTKALHSVFFVDQNTGWAVGDSGIILKTINGGEPIGIEKISNEVPEIFKLYQNYPNPFNPSTKIKFDIPQLPLTKGGGGMNNFVTLKIFDILCREIATLVNQKLPPGSYAVEWNASNYSSGIYFYRMEVRNPESRDAETSSAQGSGFDYSETKRMVLLK